MGRLHVKVDNLNASLVGFCFIRDTEMILLNIGNSKSLRKLIYLRTWNSINWELPRKNVEAS